MVAPNNQYLPPVITIPSALEISAVTNSNPMTVTLAANTDQMNTYIAGQAVKFTIPVNYGMWQLNGLTLTILSITGNVMTFNISSTQFDLFLAPPAGTSQP